MNKLKLVEDRTLYIKKRVQDLVIDLIDSDFKKIDQQQFIMKSDATKLAMNHLRDIDLVCRYGGEEFLILLSDSDIHHSLIVANKLREIIEQFIFSTNDLKINITISIGAAELKKDEKIDSFIKRVDEALYVAKKTGRNKVEHAK